MWTASVVPDVVKKLEPSGPAQSPLPVLLLFPLLIGVLGAGLVGFIGMFCFWSPARHIYLIAVLMKILVTPLMTAWSVHTGWESLFGEMELFLDGIILTLCIVGPAKELFIKKETSIGIGSPIAEPARELTR